LGAAKKVKKAETQKVFLKMAVTLIIELKILINLQVKQRFIFFFSPLNSSLCG
jgi:hypothetical protein